MAHLFSTRATLTADLARLAHHDASADRIVELGLGNGRILIVSASGAAASLNAVGGDYYSTYHKAGQLRAGKGSGKRGKGGSEALPSRAEATAGNVGSNAAPPKMSRAERKALKAAAAQTADNSPPAAPPAADNATN